MISQKSFSELRDAVSKLLHDHLMTLICSSQGQAPIQVEACKVLLCALVSDNIILPILLSCQIQYKEVGQHNTISSLRRRWESLRNAKSSVCAHHRRNSTRACRPTEQRHWDDDVYVRVFIAYDQALTWWTHSQSRGCPSQSFHAQTFASRNVKKVQEAVSFSKDYLAALKSSAMVEAAVQNHSCVIIRTRCVGMYSWLTHGCPLANT